MVLFKNIKSCLILFNSIMLYHYHVLANQVHLVGGLEHVDFPFHVWYVILPID